MNRYFDSIWLPQFHRHSCPIIFLFKRSIVLSSSAFSNVPEKYLSCLQFGMQSNYKQLRYFSGTLVKAEEDKT